MNFIASLDKFDGPLDLMLHLIREQKLDIFDLDMNILTEQYLIYLKGLEELKLEIESEYLTELATLIEYKSKKLLPKNEMVIEDEYEDDPKDRLVRRLLEYQKFKEVSAELNDLFIERQKQLSKSVSIVSDNLFDDEQRVDGNPYDLLKAMNKLMRRIQLSRPLETKFTEKEISVDDRALAIKVMMADLPETFKFEKLTDDCDSVHLFIVTFLAILDLARGGFLVFNVDNEDTIWLKRR
ncbi:MAG: segregation/condensation protein A [Erysipelotrichaceae bacterium]|nr:segregation/condensation protein A [Erysipelotrichaceae bacterium]